MSSDLNPYAVQLGKQAREAGLKLAATRAEARTCAIRRLGEVLRTHVDELLVANAKDVEAARAAGLPAPMLKRLALDANKVDAMARAVDEIAAQPDPVGHVMESRVRGDGLKIEKIRVPIGVVLFCYESRPNVTTDAAALCLRSGNAVILRGGKEAFHCNQVLGRLIAAALDDAHIDPHAVQIIETTERALLPILLKQDKYIDVVIPRGGESLIRAVVEEATMPVLKHFTGNCHIYVDRETLSVEEIVKVIVNAKTSYPGGAVCNAVEHVLVHRGVAERVVTPLFDALAAMGVEVRADAGTRTLIPAAKDATADDWDQEYLAFILGIRTVESLDEAIAHINLHGSHHTDAILSTDEAAIEQFVKRVDSASIMVNASTRLADGGEYGLGAEIGISTDKLHARGPMGAFDMTTYKYVVRGKAHLRK